VPQPTEQQRRRSFIIVVCCTFLAAAAQLLIKRGALDLSADATLLDAALGIFTDPRLFSGYALYGMFTIGLVYALRHGELSLLYPVIAVSYVWVTIISLVFFKEKMNVLEGSGVLLIVAGVAVMGRGKQS
jgi:drug/metabolite transporter (DMT)-like permease